MRAKRLEQDKFYLSPLYRTDSQLVYTHPKDLLARLTNVLGDRPYIPEGPGWSKYAEPDTPEYLFEHLVQVARIQSDAATSFAADDWRLFIYVNTLVDRVSHPYWAYANPQEYLDLSQEKAGRYAYAVKQAYREMDEHLGKLLARVDKPTYVVLASDHGFHSNVDKRQYIGTHDLAGIYLVAGPGITGRPAEEANIEDITPTALYLLDLPVADDMTGKVIPEVRDVLNRREQRVPTYEASAAARGTDEPVDKETWDQLTGLGYVDDEKK
jgi:arylsulfatase A-like enzyme